MLHSSQLLKNYQSFFSLRITSPLESTSSLTSPATSWSASSWFITLWWSSHLISVIITTRVTPSCFCSNLKTSLYSLNPTLHEHLAPLSDWFHGYVDLLTFISRFIIFLYQLSLLRFFSVFLISGFYLSHHNCLLLFTSSSVSLIPSLFVTFSVRFSLCAR